MVQIPGFNLASNWALLHIFIVFRDEIHNHFRLLGEILRIQRTEGVEGEAAHIRKMKLLLICEAQRWVSSQALERYLKEATGPKGCFATLISYLLFDPRDYDSLFIFR